jgi:F-type H+-transporting ATPase subunit a
MLRSLMLATSGPTVHIAPGTVMKIGNIDITNSMLYGWICITAIAIVLIWVAHRVTVKPKGGIIQFVEVGVEFITDLVEGAFDDATIGRKFVPYFVTVFFFILLNNWLGLLPIVGEGITKNGFPLFRPFTADLNGTLAIAVVTMGIVYTASIKYSGGFKNYISHFFVGSPFNPLYFFIAVLEMVTDLTRVISLSLRLFLNITIGEILYVVFAYLGHLLGPITAVPFTLLDVLVGALQAYIFTILATMYLAIAVNAAHQHNQEHADLTEENIPETMELSNSQGAING